MNSIFQGIAKEINTEAEYRSKIIDLENKYATSASLFQIKAVIQLFSNELLPQDVTGAKDRMMEIKELYNEFSKKLSTLSGKVDDLEHRKVFDQISSTFKNKRLIANSIDQILILNYFENISRHLRERNYQFQAHSFVLPREFIAEFLGISVTEISIQEYLLGLLRFIDFLIDYSTQLIIISAAWSELKEQYSVIFLNQKLTQFYSSGFELLDLKNDQVRRKYDGLKYNLKKINNIVYDISLRGLLEGADQLKFT